MNLPTAHSTPMDAEYNQITNMPRVQMSHNTFHIYCMKTTSCKDYNAKNDDYKNHTTIFIRH